MFKSYMGLLYIYIRSYEISIPTSRFEEEDPKLQDRNNVEE